MSGTAAVNGKPQTVAVVGGGISSLATADVLQRLGFKVTIFEKNAEIGGQWALAYPGVHLQNTCNEYYISRFPWPFKADEHPSGAQIVRYMNEAVKALQLDVRTNHEVISVAPGPEQEEHVGSEKDGPPSVKSWIVRVRNGKNEATLTFDRVVMSVGQYTDGHNSLELPGQDKFQGKIVTEREMAELGDLKGKTVMVVGMGKSALDMAVTAAEAGAAVHHVFRTPRWLLHRRILGLHFTRLLFNRFGTVMMTSWAHPTFGERLLHGPLKPVVNGFWSGIQALFTKLALWQASGTGPEGEARVRMTLPQHPLLQDLRSANALAPDTYYARVAKGEITPHHAELSSFTPTGLHLTSGAEVKVDYVVMSVGFKSPRFPFLPDSYRALLEKESDGPQLYRHIIHPRLPLGLAFAGFNHSFMHIPCAEIGALWIAAVWRGELELPSVPDMELAIRYIQQWKRANISFEPSRACAVNTRFQQYLDIMLKELGLSAYRKSNVFFEVFQRYNSGDYAGVIDEYLQKRATNEPAAKLRSLPMAT